MEPTRNFAVLCVLLAIFLAAPVAGIRCVQCMSESSRTCIDLPPAPKKCDELSRYCIVVRETFKNSSVSSVTRTCSPVDLGSKCHESFSQTGESVLVCHEACDTDGCNGLRPEPVIGVKPTQAVTVKAPQAPTAAKSGGASFNLCQASVLILTSVVMLFRVIT